MKRESPIKSFMALYSSDYVNYFDDIEWEIFKNEEGSNEVHILFHYDEIMEQLFAEFMGWA